jgi:hypothetical protein
LVTAVLSASRGALIGLVAVFVVAGVLAAGRYRRQVVAAAAVAIAGAFAVPFTRDRILGTSPLSAHTISGRDLLWRETLALFGHHPLLGTGPSGFAVAVVGEHDLTWQREIGPAFPPDSPHNWLLQSLDAGGPLLLAITLALVALVLQRLWRAREDAWTAGTLIGLVGYGVTLLFHLTSPGTTIAAATFAGAALAAPAGEAALRWWDRASVVVAGVLVVVFTSAAVSELVLRHASEQVADGRLATAEHEFDVVRGLRVWDVDLPAVIAHEFVSVSAGGDAGFGTAARSYAQRWLDRTGPIAQDESVREDRALVLEGAGRYADALTVVDGILAGDPDNPLLLLRQGVLYGELHRYPDAERALRRAASISPSSPEPWSDLATLYGLEGKPAQQAAAQRRAQQLTG